jgi:signal transduction histidine kinase
MASHGTSAAIRPTFDALIQELEPALRRSCFPKRRCQPHNAMLRDLLAGQPPWSDLPVLVLTRRGANSDELDEAVRLLGNLTLLERPLRAATLLSAVRTAVRARDRQYQIRGHLAERARVEESLRIADQRKDEFLATLGHELRNPLAPLRTGLHLLKRAGLQDPVVVRMTAVMERQISHLIRLVDDLLEVSRITRGVIDVHSEPLDLASIVRAAIDTSRPFLDAGRHERLDVTKPLDHVTRSGSPRCSPTCSPTPQLNQRRRHIWLAVRKKGSARSSRFVMTASAFQ